MKRILGLIACALLPVAALAQGGSDVNNGLPLELGKWITSRYAPTIEDKILRQDSSRNTELNAVTGKSIELTIATTPELSVSNDQIAFSGTTATVQGAGGVVLKADADVNRLLTWDASGDSTLNLTFGDAGTTANQELYIMGTTSNTDDDSAINICAGGSCGAGRGASMIVYGAEYGGHAYVNTADTAGADFYVTATDDVNLDDVLVIDTATAATSVTGAFTSSATGALGWAYVDGADNTACTSQCTSAAVFGVNLSAGATAPVLVGPSDATADACICAGAS